MKNGPTFSLRNEPIFLSPPLMKFHKPPSLIFLIAFIINGAARINEPVIKPFLLNIEDQSLVNPFCSVTCVSVDSLIALRTEASFSSFICCCLSSAVTPLSIASAILVFLSSSIDACVSSRLSLIASNSLSSLLFSSLSSSIIVFSFSSKSSCAENFLPSFPILPVIFENKPFFSFESSSFSSSFFPKRRPPRKLPAFLPFLTTLFKLSLPLLNKYLPRPRVAVVVPFATLPIPLETPVTVSIPCFNAERFQALDIEPLIAFFVYARKPPASLILSATPLISS